MRNPPSLALARWRCCMADATPLPRLFPIQSEPRNRRPATANELVYMRAYEVYSEVFGPQPAMIDLEGRGCRGGFGIGELVAFLYARSFPKNEWRNRVEEALTGLNV